MFLYITAPFSYFCVFLTIQTGCVYICLSILLHLFGPFSRLHHHDYNEIIKLCRQCGPPALQQAFFILLEHLDELRVMKTRPWPRLGRFDWVSAAVFFSFCWFVRLFLFSFVFYVCHFSVRGSGEGCPVCFRIEFRSLYSWRLRRRSHDHQTPVLH